MIEVGKREFLLHPSQYLKKIEQTGGTLIITHHHQPRIQVTVIKPKTVRSLSGKITHLKTKGSINKSVLKGFDQW